MTGPSQPPLSCGKPKYIVVLLHDAACCGEAVVELALEWAPVLNKGEFLAPDGPWGGANPGTERYWCQGRGPDSGDGIEEVGERLNRFIDQALSKRRLEPSRLALVGFGQGAGLALRAGLMRSEPLGAVVCVARNLPDPFTGIQSPRAVPPMLLVEADLDGDGAPLSLGEAASRLRASGMDVAQSAHPGDYFGLDDAGLQAISEFLGQCITPDSKALEAE